MDGLRFQYERRLASSPVGQAESNAFAHNQRNTTTVSCSPPLADARFDICDLVERSLSAMTGPWHP